jgi:cell cycle checkpoint protein
LSKHSNCQNFSVKYFIIFLQCSIEGLRYISKLEEFENFVEKIRKYAMLRPTSTKSKRKLIIILIDDIPVTSGNAAFARLGKCLTGLIQSTQVPTVISLTHYHKSESNDTAMWNSEDLESLLQGAGAHKVKDQMLTDFMMMVTYVSLAACF